MRATEKINSIQRAAGVVIDLYNLKTGINESTLLSASVLCDFVGFVQSTSLERDILASIIGCRMDVPFKKMATELNAERTELLKALNKLKSVGLLEIKISPRAGLYDAVLSLKNEPSSIVIV